MKSTTRIFLPWRRSAVYLLKNNGRVVYVGKAKDFFRRIGGHHLKRFNEIEILYLPKHKISDVEELKIREHKPKYNSVGVISMTERRLRGKTKSAGFLRRMLKMRVGQKFPIDSPKDADLWRQMAYKNGMKIQTRRHGQKIIGKRLL